MTDHKCGRSKYIRCQDHSGWFHVSPDVRTDSQLQEFFMVTINSGYSL
ncbi:hypothetical Protein YC6258_04305 [Gynuella sunshinyii YC6258]|uniref:Uncharacterized protein n=1 Tax=Gynuella sunshinyii YC6258 TaxID=1445510 RepID=A0A0C5W0Y0_9GAMM|nr:hypothetical Protein YC6258_04305 [Gynuella sunshinyii YC6258]